MQFEQNYESNQIIEWRSLYVNYSLLKKMLLPFSEIFNLQTLNKQKVSKYYQSQIIKNKSIANLNIYKRRHLQKIDLPFDLESQLKILDTEFMTFLKEEMEKSDKFYKLHLQQIDLKIKTLKYNLLVLLQNEQKQDKTFFENTELKKNHYLLRQTNQELYMECVLLEQFCLANRQAFKKISQSYQEKVYFLETFTQNCLTMTQLQKNIEIYNDCLKLNQLQEEVEHLYIVYFSRKNPKLGVQQLKAESKLKVLNSRNAFVFGFYVGLVIFFSFNIIFHQIEISINFKVYVIFIIILQYNSQSIYFPLYQSLNMFFFYAWFLTLNIYLWKTHFINYKKCLDFDYHSSSLIQICTRLSCFTLLFLIILTGSMDKEIDQNAKDLTPPEEYFNPMLPLVFFSPGAGPLIVWSFIILYFMIPTQIKLNGRGRRYFWRQMFYALISPIGQLRFVTYWLIEQFSSMILAFRSLIYTFCYYYNQASQEDAQQCSQSRQKLTGYIVSVIPFIYLLILSIRAIFQNEKKSVKDYHRIGQNIVSIILVTVGFMASEYPQIFYIWLGIGIFAAIYTSIIDMKLDWGLFQRYSEIKYLRRTLAYNNKWYYYAAMVLNLLLRFNWILSISPNVYQITNYNVIIYFIAFLEIFRRFCWNAIYFENHHIETFKIFKQIPELQFPYEVNSRDTFKFSRDTIKVSRETIKMTAQIEKRLASMQSFRESMNIRAFSENFDDKIQKLEIQEDDLIQQAIEYQKKIEGINYDFETKCYQINDQVSDILKYIQSLHVKEVNGRISLIEPLLQQ